MVEDTFDELMVERLKNMGHDITISHDNSNFGRGQMILRLENGAYVAGTETRTDGNIAIY
jgi:gamma-glutamyltranspeptidase/glutathione hydrolase